MIALTLAVVGAIVVAPAAARADGPTTFSNTASIAIPALGSPSQTGPANPYPSSITVSGMTGTVTTVQVVFSGLTHSSLGDVDAMVVSPSGENLVVLSDIGDPATLAFANNATLTFDDAAGGAVPAGNVPTGTYLPTSLGAVDAFPAPAPTPSAQTTLAGAFGGINPNGTWQLLIVDDANGDLGTMAGGWSLIVTTDTVVTGQTYCNTAAIVGGTSVGAASPYPSTISVSGLTGTVTKVTAALNGITHPVPAELDVLLSSPVPSTNLILMSDAGGGTAVTGRNVVFDDAAASGVPTPLTSGTYRPTNIEPGGGDSFPAPAPVISAATTLATFNGSTGNGQWSLWVMDDSSGDAGSISGGWCLTFTMSAAPPVTPAANPLPPTGTDSAGMALIAGALLVLGAVGVATTKRRRPARHN